MTITAPQLTDPRPTRAAEPIARTILSRRSLRYTLGLLWLLDGALQLQSYMFTTGFAHQIIEPAAAGQPLFVAGPVRWNAGLIGHHPVQFDVVFAGVQLALGVGFLIPRFSRRAVAASVAWAGGVWYFGEGMGGLAGGHTTALVGAPGAALLYIVLALAAWPPAGHTEPRGLTPGRASPPHWIGRVWAGLWIGFAGLNLLPGNSAPSTIAGELTANASMAPGWLASFDRWIGSGALAMGRGSGVLVVGVEVAVGLAAWQPGRLRRPAIWTGIVLAGVYWAAGQTFGQLFSGQATDPNTGPLLMLLGLAALSTTPVASGTVARRPSPLAFPSTPALRREAA